MPEPDSPPSRRIVRLRWALRAVALVALAAGVATAMHAWAERSHKGWRAAYYPTVDFQGEPIVRRETLIRHDWRNGSPLPSLPQDRFSVRWDTCLAVDEPRRMEVRLGSDDGTRLRVDGELQVDNWRRQGFHGQTGNVELTPGVHHVVVEYFEHARKAEVEVELLWPTLPAEP
ncbi:MAG: PA14 domain-containing protein, partial [Myxococcota bacterium]